MTLRRLFFAGFASLLALALAAAALRPAMAQSYSQDAYFGKNKAQYKHLKWKVYHAPHFDVYYYTEDADLLQKVVSYAESAYDQLSQAFDYQIQKPTNLIFYETHADFEQNNVISNFIPEGTGAFATPVRNRMFLPVDMPDHELMGLLVHELTHIFEYHVMFGGSLGKGVASGLPLWFMEGLAEYMRGEEGARDKMFVRDAVVNDNIPAITQQGVGGFFAYRYGYAVFEYMEEIYGREGVNDFILELRNTLGGRVGKAVERAFQMSPEDFDAEFRRWLRAKYLKELLETGEPADFGRVFRADVNRASNETSPVASPSGDLVAAFSTVKGDVDVVLFDTQRRTKLRNLTGGYSAKFQYFVAQELTMGREMGRDIAFSPDGNMVAFFARKDEGRRLVLVDVLKGKIRRAIPMDDVDQELSPTWHPDGQRIAFSAYKNGQFDIFEIDIESKEVSNLTDDDVFDGSPAYAPDGKTMVMTSVVGGYSKLFRIDLENPSQRLPIREGVRSQTNEIDATFSPDGKRIYFTSDASGANNIFSFDTESGIVRQHTNSVTGCFQPTVLSTPTGKDRIVFTAYWKGRMQLYRLDVDDPISEPVLVTEQEIQDAKSLSAEDLPRFEPSIEVSIDEGNKDKYRGRKFYLENIVGGQIGVSDDQTFIAQIGFLFSDFLGDQKILASFASIASFSNFDVIYLNQRRRLQWSAHLYNRKDFFVTQDRETLEINRDSLLDESGIVGAVIYPLGVNHRVALGGGYIYRDLNYYIYARDENGFPIFDPETGEPVPIISPRVDNFPQIEASMVGDTTVFQSFGPWTGRRWRIFGSYAPDFSDDGGDSSALTASVGLDLRQYVKLTKRSLIAARLWGASSEGNAPTPYYIGGLDTIRGYGFRTLTGTQAFYSNFELRFPLVDYLATPIIHFQGIRGLFFLDIGGAWYGDFESFRFWDSEENQLQDAVSSYGFGLTINLFGMNWNWDFAKRWNFDTTSGSFETSFWIGRRF